MWLGKLVSHTLLGQSSLLELELKFRVIDLLDSMKFCSSFFHNKCVLYCLDFDNPNGFPS